MYDLDQYPNATIVTFPDGRELSLITMQSIDDAMRFAGSGVQANQQCVDNRQLYAAALLATGWYSEREAENAISDIRPDGVPRTPGRY